MTAGTEAPGSADAAGTGPDGEVASDDEWLAALTELGLTVRAIVRGIARRRGRDTHLGDSQISHAQFELLIALCEHDELPAGELASAADLTPATVTQMLDHLAERGYVERARSEADRRVVVSRLTPLGRRLVLARRNEWRSRWEEALSPFSAQDMLTAARVLTSLRAVFEEDSAPAQRD